ncbi:MAG: NifU family protein, partial [Gemmatimonadetes bacterium]|nr:NifU family protein [Gemmatimonadota bacterium]
ESDEEIDAGFLKVLVDQSSRAQVEGATVDYVERVNESGFEIRPAASASPPSAPPQEAPKGEIAEKVRHVLDTQVNPAVASHGGSINLVDVQGTDIYIEMLGGCQGCAMSRMTLKQGVERMLRQEVPEVGTVHDVTDHHSGDNPYF